MEYTGWARRAEDQVPEFWRGFQPKQQKLSASNSGRNDARAGLPCDPAYPGWRLYVKAYEQAYRRQIARQEAE